MSSLPLLALMEDAPTEPALCVHRRNEHAVAEHQLCAEGRCCNHAVVCDDCGAVVGVESWRLDIGAKEHDKTYGRAA